MSDELNRRVPETTYESEVLLVKLRTGNGGFEIVDYIGHTREILYRWRKCMSHMKILPAAGGVAKQASNIYALLEILVIYAVIIEGNLSTMGQRIQQS